MLNDYKFKSIFKNELNYFIKYKKNSGLKYENELYRLIHVDNILYNLKLKSKQITKETFNKLVEINNMSKASYARQYGVTKDFCKYLISNEYKNIYYKEKKFNITNKYIPVIFNDEEILRLFDIMDSFANEYINSKYYQLYYTYSILFRLIYACGLRISEVLKITIDDVNLKENTINIINSKRHVSRMLVISESMNECLKIYVQKFNIIDGLLFKNYHNSIISQNCLRAYYKKMLNKAGLNEKARIHDLRHQFCNNAFNQMLDRGYDENVVIVYLYKYMGHKYINETEYYLHFTKYNKNKLIEINDKFTKKLYEGVELDNE